MGSVFLIGNSWVGEYKDRGKVRRKTFGKKGIVTKTMAKEMLNKIEQKIKLGQYDMLDNDIPRLNDFSRDYVKHMRDTVQRRSWSRYEYSLNRLIELYGDKKLSEISPKDIDDFKEIRLRDAKPATVNRELSTLRQIYNLAKRWRKFFGENPVSIAGLLPEENIQERILTLEEEEKLLSFSNDHLKPIIITALSTGMRKSEILTLRWTNIDLESGVITIEQTNTKNKKMRRVPISSSLRTLLIELKLKGGGNEFVFLSLAGTPYKNHESLKGAFERVCEKAGIAGFRFHDLRHTAATRMIERGASIVAVSKILGHSDLKMTMRYSHPEESLKEAVELLSDKFSTPFTDIFTDMNKRDK
ncbi:MAG: tyrosine-type recombinase/integrase [Thermodesulfobacteriota bacterium]